MMLSAAACALLAGCPHDRAAPPGVMEALRQRLVAPGTQAILATVLDGDQLDDLEYRLDRRAILSALEAVHGLPEAWLRKAADDFTYAGLLAEPHGNRGKLVFAYLVVGELKRLWRHDLTLLVGGTPQGEFYAFVFPATTGRGRLYGGDVVWCSGVFVKAFRFQDGRGIEHRVPLLAGPHPTYTGKWFPHGLLLKELGLEGFFPVTVSAEAPPPAIFLRMDEMGWLLHGSTRLSRKQLESRLEATGEAASIRGEPGIVVLRADAAAPKALVADFARLVLEKGLRLVLRPPKG